MGWSRRSRSASRAEIEHLKPLLVNSEIEANLSRLGV
jgi:hypothetical protein